MSQDLSKNKKAEQSPTTSTPNTTRMTGSWLMGGTHSCDGHVHGPGCNHAHGDDEDCDHDH